MIKCDFDLERQVELKATGANIHTVRQFTCLYGGAVFGYNTAKSEEKKKYWVEEIEKYEKILRIFLATGILPKR
jgi:hypothetical protein